MAGLRWLAHSRMVWFINAIDGTRYSTRPPTPARRSAIHSDTTDLPVPQGSTSLPLSCSVNPATTFATASAWNGLGV